MLGFNSIAQNVTNLFLHAVAVARRPSLQLRLDFVFKISDDQSRHAMLISLYQPMLDSGGNPDRRVSCAARTMYSLPQ